MSDMSTCAKCGGNLNISVSGYGGDICNCNKTIYQLHSEQSKRIAELEAENVKFQKRITIDVFKIEKLQAQNAELMEAVTCARSQLLMVVNDINNDRVPFDGDEFHETLEKCDKALAKKGE